MSEPTAQQIALAKQIDATANAQAARVEASLAVLPKDMRAIILAAIGRELLRRAGV